MRSSQSKISLSSLMVLTMRRLPSRSVTVFICTGSRGSVVNAQPAKVLLSRVNRRQRLRFARDPWRRLKELGTVLDAGDQIEALRHGGQSTAAQTLDEFDERLDVDRAGLAPRRVEALIDLLLGGNRLGEPSEDNGVHRQRGVGLALGPPGADARLLCPGIKDTQAKADRQREATEGENEGQAAPERGQDGGRFTHDAASAAGSRLPRAPERPAIRRGPRSPARRVRTARCWPTATDTAMRRRAEVCGRLALEPSRNQPWVRGASLTEIRVVQLRGDLAATSWRNS
jgi:hypothetical protein